MQNNRILQNKAFANFSFTCTLPIIREINDVSWSQIKKKVDRNNIDSIQLNCPHQWFMSRHCRAGSQPCQGLRNKSRRFVYVVKMVHLLLFIIWLYSTHACIWAPANIFQRKKKAVWKRDAALRLVMRCLVSTSAIILF